MSKQVAIDSNVLVAILDDRDTDHAIAVALLNALEDHAVTIIYFDCVMNETISVLARRMEQQQRSYEIPHLLNRLKLHVPADAITWIACHTERLYNDIIALVHQTLGALNVHDALIALACRELDIPFLVSLDRDFDRINWLTRIIDPNDAENYLQ